MIMSSDRRKQRRSCQWLFTTIIKEYVKEAILEGVIENNFEQAYKLMEEKAAELGLK